MNLTIDGNYHQFYLEDGEYPKETDSDFWTEEAFKRHLAICNGCIGFGSMTSLDLNVTVDLFNARPDLNLDQYDHIVEASISVSSGCLVVCGCVDYRPEAKHICVANGEYRVRYCIQDIHTVKNEFDGKEKYFVWVWPEKRTSVEVIKQQTIYS